MCASIFFIGLDLGGTSIKAGLVTPKGEVIKTHIEHLTGRTVEKVLASFEAAINHFVKNDHISCASDLLAIGVCAPGECDPEKGIVHNLTNFQGFHNVPLGPYITKLTSRPCALVNDADAACVGEWWTASIEAAAHRDRAPLSNMCMLTLGTGVGCGIIADGRLLRGMGMAAEYGHVIVVDAHDPLIANAPAPTAATPASPHFYAPIACPCGQSGCLERYAGAEGMVNMAVIKAIGMHAGLVSLPWDGVVADSALLMRIAARAQEINAANAAAIATAAAAGAGAAVETKSPEEVIRFEVKCEHIFAAARAGDKFALYIEDKVADLLGVAVLNLARTVDTQSVTIGGGAALAGGQTFIDKIKAAYNKRSWKFKRHELLIVPAKMGNNAGFYGMAKLAKDTFGESWDAQL
jgi:glucokinase